MNHICRNLTPKIDVLNIELVEIKTFAGRELKFNSTMALELFKSKRLGSNKHCFELAVTSELKNEGINKIKIQAEIRKFYVYQKGWIPAGKPKVYYKDASKLLIKHELIQLKDYDGKPCIEDLDYRNDICRREFIQNVSTYTNSLVNADSFYTNFTT